MDIQNRIRDILSDTIQQDFMGQSGKVGEEELLHKLKQQGLVDDILHQLQFRDQQGGTTPATHFLDRDDKVTQLPTKKGMVFFFRICLSKITLVIKFKAIFSSSSVLL